MEVKDVGGGPKVGRRATFDTFFVYEKNLLHGRFVERNTACLIRCDTFQISDKGSGSVGRVPLFAPYPTQNFRNSTPYATLDYLERQVRLQCPHSHFFLTFLLLPQLYPFLVGGERFKTLRTCYGPISIH